MKSLSIKHFIMISLISSLCLFAFMLPSKAKAKVLGDNYPNQWQKGLGVDPWNMYWRQCTSFVAFRLSSSNHFQLPLGYGNAEQWGNYAKSQGYHVDKNPAIGSVAWFSSGVNGASQLGHVAWVADVHKDTVTLEEYNYNAGQGPEKYYSRTIAKTAVSGYIHFKDLNTTFKVGDQVIFTKVFQTSHIIGNNITSDEVAGGKSTYHNIIDPTPTLKTDHLGHPTKNQVLSPGDFFRIPGKYRILSIDIPTNGLLIQIGRLKTWVSADCVSRY